MTRNEFIAAWKEHRERFLFEHYKDDSARLGPKLAAISEEGTEFWRKWKHSLAPMNVTVFFNRVLRAHKEAQKHVG